MDKALFFLLIISIMSCNGGCNESSSSSDQYSAEVLHENFEPQAPSESIGQNIDNATLKKRRGAIFKRQACSLISLKIIAEALEKPMQEISLSNATPRDADPAQTACFYKWSDYEVPNAGIFLQLLRNPLGDEYPDYVSKMIESKRTLGEQAVEATPIIFKKFEGFGDDGAYSTEGGKYYWRLGEEVVFHIAFNTSHGPNDQYRIAATLAKAMTQSYLR